MLQATEIYYFLFGLLLTVMGVMHYAKMRTFPALVLGLLYGLALMGAGGLLLYGSCHGASNMTNATVKLGLIIGLLVTAALAGQFIPRVMTDRAAPFVLLMSVLSGVGMVLTLVWFGK